MEDTPDSKSGAAMRAGSNPASGTSKRENMTIYISIATLEDPDLHNTLMSAIFNSDDRKQLHIGIAATTEEKFYEERVVGYEKFAKVSTKLFDIKNNRGLAKGRINSRFAYDDEDYILQIDSHTNFEKSWDTKLKQLYDGAIKETSNDKTILTSYLSPYVNLDGKAVPLERWSRYCVYTNYWVAANVRLMAWEQIPMHIFPEQYRRDSLFVPANKTGAHFMFSNKRWAYEQYLPESIVFAEEEVIHTIHLLENNFSLVFPNSELPLTHRYTNLEKDVQRKKLNDLFSEEDFTELVVTRNMFDLVNEHRESCIKYTEYGGYDILHNNVRPFHIPKDYSW